MKWQHWLLHLLTSGMLALCVETATRGWALRDVPVAKYRIEVIPEGNRPQAGHLFLDAVLADGKLVRQSMDVQVPGWTALQIDGGVPPYLRSHSPDGSASVLDVSAATLVMRFSAASWAGKVRLYRNGAPVRVHAVHANGPANFHAEWTEFPRTQLRFWVLTLTFVSWFGVGVVARSYLVRWPAAWLAVVLSLGHLCYWVSMPFASQPDTDSYWLTLKLLPMGQVAYHPPGYSLMLGAMALAGGEKNLPALTTLVQHGMSVVMMVWTFLMLRRLVLPDLALACTLFAGFTMPVLSAAQNILTECPTCFAVTGAVYFSFRAAESRHYAYVIAAGLLSGWACLMRVVPIVGLIPAMCAMIWLSPNISVRRRAMLSAAGTATALIVTIVPMIWYASHDRRFRLSNATGYHLFNRAVYDQKLFEPSGPATKNLISLMPDRDLRNSWNWEISGDPRVRDIPWDELESIVRESAMEAIRANKIAFLAYTPRLAWKLYSVPTGWLPRWGDSPAELPLFERSPLLPLTTGGIDWNDAADRWNRRVWPTACWLSVVAFLLYIRHPERRIVAAMTLAPSLYLLASATVAVYAERYNAPVVPLVYALAAMTAHAVIVRIAALVREFKSSREVSPKAVMLEE